MYEDSSVGVCFICGKCFGRHTNRCIHHIIPERFDVDDLLELKVALCSKCHGALHALYVKEALDYVVKRYNRIFFELCLEKLRAKKRGKFWQSFWQAIAINEEEIRNVNLKKKGLVWKKSG